MRVGVKKLKTALAAVEKDSGFSYYQNSGATVKTSMLKIMMLMTTMMIIRKLFLWRVKSIEEVIKQLSS